MKKYAWLAAGMVALGLGVFCACGGDGESSGSHDGNDPVDDPISEQLGVFDDYIWKSSDYVLDLSNRTLEGASSFSINSVSGENAGTVINCTVDGAEYNLSLNDYGALEMVSASDNTVACTFLVDAISFSGSWYDEDGSSGYYYAISDKINSDGYYSFKRFTQVGYTLGDPSNAVTVFEIYDDGSVGISFGVFAGEDDDTDYDFSYVFYYAGTSQQYMYMNDGSVTGDTVLDVYTGAYASTYINNDGDTISLNVSGGLITYGGHGYMISTNFGGFGGGIYFTDGTTEYLLVSALDGTYLRTVESSEEFAAYDSSWLPGDNASDNSWSLGSDANEVAVFSDDKSVNFNGRVCALSTAVENGSVVYKFTSGNYNYTISPVYGSEDVFSVQSDFAAHNGYWIRDSVKKTFVQTFTSNSQDIEINEFYELTITSKTYGEDSTVVNPSGVFTYLADLGSIAISYNPFGPGGTTLNLVQVNMLGIYWSIAISNDGIALYSSYLSEDFLPEAVDMITESFGITETNYVFTTGGNTPETLNFNFDDGIVYVDGVPGYFTWGYAYIRGTTEPDLYVEINGEQVETADGYEYYRYTIFPGSTGLEVTYARVMYNTATGEYTIDEETSEDRFYMANSTYTNLLNLKLVYRGEYVDSTISFAEDGSLNIETYDQSTDSSDIYKVNSCDYSVLITNTNGREIITLTYTLNGAQNTLVITDGLYARLNSLVYAVDQLADAAGTYYNSDGGYISLTTDAILQDSNINVTDITNIVCGDNDLTITYNFRGTSHTAVFADGALTVDGVDYTKVAFTPDKFVGTYSITVKLSATVSTTVSITVKSSVSGVNDAITLAVTLNGESVPCTFTYENGNQQIRFSGFDFATFDTLQCVITLEGDNLVFSVNGVEVDSEYSASDWSYNDFEFDGTKNVGEGTLSCIVKEGAPMFIYNGVLCDNYVVSVNGNVKTLRVRCGNTYINLTVEADGEVTAQLA